MRLLSQDSYLCLPRDHCNLQLYILSDQRFRLQMSDSGFRIFLVFRRKPRHIFGGSSVQQQSCESSTRVNLLQFGVPVPLASNHNVPQVSSIASSVCFPRSALPLYRSSFLIRKCAIFLSIFPFSYSENHQQSAKSPFRCPRDTVIWVSLVNPRPNLTGRN